MSRIQKTTLIFVAALVVFVLAVSMGIRTLLADPERFRPIITSQIEAGTGFNVAFTDLSWELWPNLAINLTDLKVEAIQGPQPLLTIDEIFVEVALLPMVLDQALQIDAIQLGAVTVRLLERADGTNNYTPMDSSTSEDVAAGPTSPTDNLPASLSVLSVETLTIEYFDEKIDGNITLSLKEVSGSLTDNLLTLQSAGPTAYEDTDLAIRFLGRLEGVQVIDIVKGELAFDEFKLDGKLSTPLSEETPFSAILSGDYHIGQDALTLQPALLEFLGLQTQITGVIKHLTTPAYALDLALESTLVDAERLNQMAPVEDLGLGPLRAFRLEAAVGGSDLSPEFKNINGIVNGTTFKGEGSFAEDFNKVSVSLQLGDIDLGELKTDAGPNPADQDPIAKDQVLIPVADLAPLNLDIALKVNRLSLNPLTLNNISVKLINREGKANGVLEADLNSGNLSTNISSAYDTKALTNIAIQAHDVDLNSIFTDQTLGRLSLNTHLEFTGTTLGALSNSLRGETHLWLRDGLIDLRAVKEKVQVLDQLGGTQSGVGAWPDQLAFDEMTGQHQFRQGIYGGQNAGLKYSPMTLQADGGFDWFAETLGFDVALTIAANARGPLKLEGPLTDVPWPARCEASFADFSPSSCRIDRTQTQKILADMAKKALKDKSRTLLDRVLEDKAPDKLKDLFKGLLGT